MGEPMQIHTNNIPREVVYWHELTNVERAEFDYLDREGQSDTTFFRYKGNVYDLGEFMRAPADANFNGWDGYANDSFFSGVVVKYARDEYDAILDYDFVVIGWYTS